MIIRPSGGVAQSSDRSVVLTFPQGAVDSDSRLIVRRLDPVEQVPPPPPPSMQPGETLLRVSLTELGGGRVETLLDRVGFCVRPALRDVEVADGDTSRLTLARYDTATGRWHPLERVEGPDQEAVCVGTLELSDWMLFTGPALVPVAGPGLGRWWLIGGATAGFLVLAWLLFNGWGKGYYRPVLERVGLPGGRTVPHHVRFDEPAPMAPPLKTPWERRARARAHAQTSRQRAKEAVTRIESAEQWDETITEDIVVSFDAAVEALRGAEDPPDAESLTLLETAGSDVESQLGRSIDAHLEDMPVFRTTQLLEAIRASRVAQFMARLAASDPDYMGEAPPLSSLAGRWREEVEFAGRVARLHGRGCVVSGVEVVLPDDEALLAEVTEGARVRVGGALGPNATVFATRVDIIVDSE